MEILVVAGDPSGDLHASHLIRALKAKGPAGLRVVAVGGPLMAEQADEFLEDLASRGVTGFWEPVVKLPFMLKLALRLKRRMQEGKTSALVCVDYYGFNRRVLGIAKSLGVPALYYISPQVWASRPGRVRELKRLVRKMLVIFPFEADVYKKAGVPCEFVGHPLLDLLPAPESKRGVSPPLRVGLLPGSRASEVAKHLPLLVEAFLNVRRRYPDSKAQIFAAASLPDSAYDFGAAPDVEIVRESDYSARRELDLALCSSGTATLENALLGIPMVVVYKMSWLTYRIARAIIKVKHIAMANIIAGKTLAPELIQKDATADRVAHEALKLLENPRKYGELRAELAGLRDRLGEKGAAAKAAATILSEISS